VPEIDVLRPDRKASATPLSSKFATQSVSEPNSARRMTSRGLRDGCGRDLPAPMSAARLSRPRPASRHLSRSMKSDTEAPEHGDWSESQTSVAPPKVYEAVEQGHGAHRAIWH
jgi:hypothetical protein